MFTAISTTENRPNIQIPIFPDAKTFCAMAVALVMASNTCLAAAPVQTFEANQNTFFSTDTANRDGYNNGNISFWLEGASVMSADKTQNLMRLLEIEQLQDNWNGNGASSFSKNILSCARQIVMSLLIQPAIFPTARDSIQFEYENNLGDYLELELFENGRIKMFSFDHMGRSTTEDIVLENVNKVVSKFYGRDIQRT